MGKSCFILFVALMYSCTSPEKEVSRTNSSEDRFYVDTPFDQEYHQGYNVSLTEVMANDVRAIQPDQNGTIWIATKNGMYSKKMNSDLWQLEIVGKDQGPGYDVAIDNENNIWLATWNGVYRHGENGIEKLEHPKPPIAKIVVAQEGVYALGPYGIWFFRDDQWIEKEYGTARSIRAAASDGKGGLWIGTDVGLYHVKEGEKTKVYQQNGDLVSAYVKGIDTDDQGQLWIGCMGGTTIRNEQGEVRHLRPEHGIPNAMVNVVKKSPQGTMWIGTDYGITRFTPGDSLYSVRLSKRWLQSNEVRDIAFDKEGNAWIATAKGVSAIRKSEMTLSQKADYFYDQLIRRHVREPWIVARSKLTIPGDTTSIEPDDDDNDGEYTAMYLAMESFRFAATRNPEAKRRAKKAFDFLHYLREITERDGFFARTIIPVSWEQSHDMNRTFSAQEIAEAIIENPRQKPVEIRWHVSSDGKWKWKGDTSSDELCGHLFGYYWYYTLVADTDEKERIAAHFSKIMDHLIRNDFNLTDVDGFHTKWGVWSPRQLNEDPEWVPERALNSLELLAFLKFTYHITNDDKYQKEYINLIENEGYLENAKRLHTTNPAWETYFDIYLSLYLYPSLVQLEEDRVLKGVYQEHLQKWFDKHRNTKSPFLNFTYNLLANNNEGLDDSIEFLKDAPLDLVDWYIDNGLREDLQVVRKPILEELQVALRPPSEYRTIRWDRNPYQAASGNPAQEREPVYWLLPYWMGRYLTLITDQ